MNHQQSYHLNSPHADNNKTGETHELGSLHQRLTDLNSSSHHAKSQKNEMVYMEKKNYYAAA
jgi:hypothetical protein